MDTPKNVKVTLLIEIEEEGSKHLHQIKVIGTTQIATKEIKEGKGDAYELTFTPNSGIHDCSVKGCLSGVIISPGEKMILF